MKMHRSKGKCTGFTLLEIVVSITILALIALMISKIFSESTRAVERGRDDAELDETARMLLDIMEDDISQALIRTNVAFHVDNSGTSLYFISTGVRRRLEGIRRDTAPMRIELISDNPWDNVLRITSPDQGSAPETADSIQRFSAYYTGTPQAEFQGMLQDMGETDYTDVFSNGTARHAALTQLAFRVNGNADWTGGNPIGTGDIPRFVDVTVGLVPSDDAVMAARKNNTQLIRNAERIYTRRIFLRNTGTDGLSF